MLFLARLIYRDEAYSDRASITTFGAPSTTHQSRELQSCLTSPCTPPVDLECIDHNAEQASMELHHDT